MEGGKCTQRVFRPAQNIEGAPIIPMLHDEDGARMMMIYATRGKIGLARLTETGDPAR